MKNTFLTKKKWNSCIGSASGAKMHQAAQRLPVQIKIWKSEKKSLGPYVASGWNTGDFGPKFLKPLQMG